MTQGERILRIALGGELTLSRREEIAALLSGCAQADQVVLDLHAVLRIDPPVMALLVRARDAFVNAGGKPQDFVVLVPVPLRKYFGAAGLARSSTVLTSR
jgi:anti-anti-sigma regulatory factor